MSTNDNSAGRDRPLSVFVLGATGRLGRILQWAWNEDPDIAPIWQSRSGAQGPQAVDGHWVIGPLSSRVGTPDVILNLAGVVSGKASDFAQNIDLGLIPFSTWPQVPVVTASTAAVYGGSGGLSTVGDACQPQSEYGRSKLQMEREISRQPSPTYGGHMILRVGNVAGADQLLGRRSLNDCVALDTFPDGATPVRSYIGPRGFGEQLKCLVLHAARGRTRVVETVNVTSAPPVEMSQLLQAAGIEYRPVSAPDHVLRTVALTVPDWIADKCDGGGVRTIAQEWIDYIAQTGGHDDVAKEGI